MRAHAHRRARIAPISAARATSARASASAARASPRSSSGLVSDRWSRGVERGGGARGCSRRLFRLAARPADGSKSPDGGDGGARRLGVVRASTAYRRRALVHARHRERGVRGVLRGESHFFDVARRVRREHRAEVIRGGWTSPARCRQVSQREVRPEHAEGERPGVQLDRLFHVPRPPAPRS